MKKLTSIAAALTMATAFCGFCAGCASDIESDAEKTAGVTLGVSQAAEGDHEVILNPGWYYNGSTKVDNTIEDAGAEKMTADQANGEAGAHNGYFVDNAYFARVSAGENLPSPTTTRTGMTFAGWAYAKDGEVVWVEKMPSTLTEDLYLYAEWRTEGSGTPDPDPGPDPGPGPDPDPGPTTEDVMTVGTTTHKLVLNTDTSTADGRSKEYWFGEDKKVDLKDGDVVSFTIDGKTISAYVNASSVGVDKSAAGTEKTQFKITKTGKFAVYIRYYPKGNNGKGSYDIEFAGPTTVDTADQIPAGATACVLNFSGGKTVTLYLKKGDAGVSALSSYNLWMWNGGTDFFTKWPGQSLSANMTLSYPLTDATAFLINWSSGSQQTHNFIGVLEDGCSYVITLENGKGSIAKLSV